MIIDRQLIFTKHAIRRMNELGISRDSAISMIHNSERQELRDLREYKVNKYGNDQFSTQYWKNGPYLFTTMFSKDEDGNDIIKVITVSNGFMSHLRKNREKIRR